MAVKPPKSVQPESNTEIDLETALAKKLAEQLDSEIDYGKLTKMTIVSLASLAKKRFVSFLTSGDSPYVPMTEIDVQALSEGKAND
jgi:hypothetical protein